MNIYHHSGRYRGWLMAALLGLAVGMGTAPAQAAVERHKSTSAKKHRHHKVSKAAHKKVAHRIVHEDLSKLTLSSNAAMVLDQATGAVLFEKNAGAVLPIASITKLMTAMVALDARPDLEETMVIDDADVDTSKGTHSRLKVGTQLQREDMLRLALMSSENRAASALARYYPGGMPAFVAAMNAKAAALGLHDTRYYDSTGLNAGNVSSARDLVRMVGAAARYPLIREFSTTAEYMVDVGGRPRQFHNTNPLVANADWQIGVSKTGYIRESGKCLVMQAWLKSKSLIIVLLDSAGRYTRVADAARIKKWLEGAVLSEQREFEPVGARKLARNVRRASAA